MIVCICLSITIEGQENSYCWKIVFNVYRKLGSTMVIRCLYLGFTRNGYTTHRTSLCACTHVIRRHDIIACSLRVTLDSSTLFQGLQLRVHSRFLSCALPLDRLAERGARKGLWISKILRASGGLLGVGTATK